MNICFKGFIIGFALGVAAFIIGGLIGAASYYEFLK